ncbi:unnamed protein product [Allacma fusca]|uniref:Integrase zinc-binding domain-containing protein n=1 Tax=Allacma fusca TaxID=39272 RepID=A0A8J2LGR4_9HEXA|nr:unnamed protein product [Allacma fusca]
MARLQKNLKGTAYMLNPELTEELVSKLTSHLKLKWGKFVLRQSDPITLKHLANWLDNVANAASITSSFVFETDSKPGYKKDDRFKKKPETARGPPSPVTLMGPKGSVDTYALFDEASTETLIDGSLVRKLGLKGQHAPLNIQWINSQTSWMKESMNVSVDIVVDVESLIGAQPQILLGKDNYHLIVPRELIEGPPNAPVTTNTKLGWLIHGVNYHRHKIDYTCSVFRANKENDDLLHQLVKEHFKLESLGVSANAKPMRSKEEQRAEMILEKTTRRVGERWETGLLWKCDEVKLPESFVRKLFPDGIACDSPRLWYLPHFAHFNPNKPDKLRLISDTASKSNGTSLNDNLLTGPDFYAPLTSVLFRFRQRRIGFGGDIQEMFPQTKIIEEDLPAQRFLWREMERGQKFPDAVHAIVTQHYTDDYYDSADTKEEAITKIQSVIYVHERGGYKIRNWSSSSKEVLKEIPVELRYTGYNVLNAEFDLPNERVPEEVNVMIKSFQSTRCYFTGLPDDARKCLHIFCDASEKAMSVAAYITFEVTGEINTSFAMGKSKVAPLAIAQVHPEIRTRGRNSKRCKTYVAHRLGEIQESSDATQWHWIPATENVADEGTRDLKAAELTSTGRWINGPKFLKLPPSEWPKDKGILKIEEFEPEILEIKRECRKLSVRITNLTVLDIFSAKVYWWKRSQLDSFPIEVALLTKGKILPSSSRLHFLSPYIDENGVLRVIGRTSEATEHSQWTKNPVILDPKHYYTILVGEWFHGEANHYGMETVANEIRQRFWILHLRTFVKSIWGNCQWCKNLRAQPKVPEMAPLPEFRVTRFQRAFTVTGLLWTYDCHHWTSI